MKVAITLILLLGIAGSCSVRVNSKNDPSVDFTKYKTFCWLNGCEFTYSGPTYLQDTLLREKIKNAIIAEMEKKGLRHQEDNPDLLLDFHISVENETSVVYHHHEDDQYNGQYQFQPFPEQELINYLVGTIVIDMVDREEARMVWRSEAIGYMDVHPDLSEKNIRKGIATSLENFPPRSEKLRPPELIVLKCSIINPEQFPPVSVVGFISSQNHDYQLLPHCLAQHP